MQDPRMTVRPVKLPHGLTGFFHSFVSVFLFSFSENSFASNHYPITRDSQMNILKGKKLYKQYCASCHQPSGLGLGDQYPPLAGSEWVSANPELIVKVILKGLKGEIQVKGKTYAPAGGMAAVTNLKSDRDIANVTTYVRQAWGNDATEVTEQEVANARADSAEQKDQWIGEALQSEYLSVASTE